MITKCYFGNIKIFLDLHDKNYVYSQFHCNYFINIHINKGSVGKTVHNSNTRVYLRRIINIATNELYSAVLCCMTVHKSLKSWINVTQLHASCNYQRQLTIC